MEDRSSRRMRTLVTLMAGRGLSANQMACALISMMARSTRSKQRPDTLMQDRYLPDRQKPLATRGRTIHQGQTRTSSLGAARPLPPSADMVREGQSVGQAAQFCLV